VRIRTFIEQLARLAFQIISGYLHAILTFKAITYKLDQGSSNYGSRPQMGEV